LINEILDIVVDFAKSEKQILAIGLCGSWARGSAKPDSDIDIIAITEDKMYFKNSEWLDDLEFDKISERIVSFKDCVYGQVWSRHVFLDGGSEIELSFADKTWANIENLDEGTAKVVSDGFKILYDPYLLLDKLAKNIFDKLNN